MTLRQTLVTTPVAFTRGWGRYALERYHKLSAHGKAIVWFLILFNIGLLVGVIILTPARIAQFVYDKAHQVSELQYGYLIFGAVIILASFPPSPGHTTMTMMCGFAYGMKGFYIAAVASVMGSSMVFLLFRFFFRHKVNAWSSKNVRWKALTTVIKAKGLPLIVLIRICPFPSWAYASVFFSSIEAVAFWQFVVATLFLFPKFALYVFIGTRMAELSDGNQRIELDTQTKIIDGLLIAGGFVVGIGVGIFVYKEVKNHIRRLEGFPPEVDELAVQAIDEEAPLLSSALSDEEEA